MSARKPEKPDPQLRLDMMSKENDDLALIRSLDANHVRRKTGERVDLLYGVRRLLEKMYFVGCKRGVCFASQDYLAESAVAGRCNVRTIRRWTQYAIRLGVVTFEVVGRKHVYTIQFESLRRLVFFGPTPDTLSATPDTLSATPDTLSATPDTLSPQHRTLCPPTNVLEKSREERTTTPTAASSSSIAVFEVEPVSPTRGSFANSATMTICGPSQPNELCWSDVEHALALFDLRNPRALEAARQRRETPASVMDAIRTAKANAKPRGPIDPVDKAIGWWLKSGTWPCEGVRTCEEIESQRIATEARRASERSVAESAAADSLSQRIEYAALNTQYGQQLDAMPSYERREFARRVLSDFEFESWCRTKGRFGRYDLLVRMHDEASAPVSSAVAVG